MRCTTRRGSLMLGFAALVVMLAVLSGIVLETSLRAYRASAMAEWRLQALASAEGAAVAYAANPFAAEPMAIGTCAVEPGAFTDGVLTLNAQVASASGRPVYEVIYLARYEQHNGAWQFAGLERGQ